MNKIMFIPAYFEPIGESKTIKVPTGETKPGFLGIEKAVTRKEERWEQTGWSDCRIDGKRLADDLAEVTKQLNIDGYEVISVTPVTSGGYNFSYKDYSESAYGYGYGFSYTNSLIVVAKLAKTTG